MAPYLILAGRVSAFLGSVVLVWGETHTGDADGLDIPLPAFDLVVADECHRGYTSQELSVWRDTFDHFDAVKTGLPATPTAHAAAYFTHKAFAYGYDQAAKDGHLVDYDVVNVRSEVRMNSVFLREGDKPRRQARPTRKRHLRQARLLRREDHGPCGPARCSASASPATARSR